MTIWDEIEAHIAAGTFHTVHFGRSAMASRNGLPRFCTLDRTDASAVRGSGRGETCEEALRDALAKIGAPAKSTEPRESETELEDLLG